MASNAIIKQIDDRERNFITLYIETGDPKRAAKEAGYGLSYQNGARSSLLSQAHIAWALAIETRKRMATSAPMALRTIEELAQHAESEKVRLEAAKALLDRAGYVAPRASIAPPKEEKPLNEQSTDELQALASRLESELAGRAKSVPSADLEPKDDEALDVIG